MTRATRIVGLLHRSGFRRDTARSDAAAGLAVGSSTRALIERTRKISPEAADRIFEATPIVGEPTEHALEAGEARLIGSSRRDDEPPAAVS